MEPHNGEEHPEPGRLRDNPAFRELAELMESIPADRRADAFTAAESTPLKVFDPHGKEAITDDLSDHPAGN